MKSELREQQLLGRKSRVAEVMFVISRSQSQCFISSPAEGNDKFRLDRGDLRLKKR